MHFTDSMLINLPLAVLRVHLRPLTLTLPSHRVHTHVLMLYTVFAGQFMGRTFLFCLLWVATNYLLIRSLRALACTDVITLYSTNVAFVYLLSWVILHEQFVGVRVSATR